MSTGRGERWIAIRWWCLFLGIFLAPSLSMAQPADEVPLAEAELSEEELKKLEAANSEMAESDVDAKSLEEMTAEQRFQESNRAFDRGMSALGAERDRWLRTSIDLLERILEDDGIENGHLYYNLGNAYYALGEVGHSILNYRRAQRLIPGNALLAENLESAIARRVDAANSDELSRVVRTLTLRDYWIGYASTVRLFAGTFVAFWVLLAVRLFRKPPGFRILATLLLLGFVFSGAAAAYYILTDGSDRSGVIVAETTTARQGPGQSYESRFTGPLHAGTEFERIGERSGWWNVTLDNGDECWIPAEDADLVRP